MNKNLIIEACLHVIVSRHRSVMFGQIQHKTEQEVRKYVMRSLPVNNRKFSMIYSAILKSYYE